MQKTICHHFLDTCARLGDQTAVKRKVRHKWENISWKEYHEKVRSLAFGLQQAGLKKSERLGIVSDTRFEWAVTDMACLSLGSVLVPIYSSNTAEDMEFILNNAEVKILVLENDLLIEKWNKIKEKCPQVEQVYIIETKQSELPSWDSLGEKASAEFDLKSTINQIDFQDTASIVYTSGTTGMPKGVVLRHEQIMSEINDVFDALSVSDKDTSLSFLPFSHIFGRCEHWGQTYVGFTMAYAENIESLRDNLLEVSPTFLVAVPRIFEKIYNGVISAAEASPVKHKLFLWAVEVGKKISWFKQHKERAPVKLLLEYKLAHKLIFSKLAEKLGGKVRFAISGGAPLNGDIAEFFHAAGLLILEGYGLTETCAAFTLNTAFSYKFGSVGKPLGDSEVKLEADGEILVKSKKVMKEYYKNPEATNEVFTEDGFFRTGDVGKIDEQGFIIITDRKKDLIKTAGGKYIAPQKLEKYLKLSKYVSNVLIHGDKKKYVVALITLDPDTIKAFAEKNNISYNSFEELTDKNEIYQLIREVVAEVNSQLASYETIKAFHILDHDFTIEGGQLTPSLKVKRKKCDQMYEKEIAALYGKEAAQDVPY
jgi:long-chain acyl-CoA synthetase